MTKNTFDILGDIVYIHRDEWESVASASIRDDYKDEMCSVTWTINNGYLFNKKLGYLHIFVVKKWYGEDHYAEMLKAGFVVDHMDNNSFNCTITNLSFLSADENKAKGFTVDKLSEDKSHIALSLFKDFNTGLYQITIHFNYPATAKITNLSEAAVIELAYLLYEDDYRIVLNDAREILYKYDQNYIFEPETLNFIDYHIEGSYGKTCSVNEFDEYNARAISAGRGFVRFIKRAGIKNWNRNDNRHFFHLLPCLK